jgi:hypothetical protein
MEQEKARLLPSLTTEECANAYLALCREGEPHLLATDELFRPEREKYLIELQEKLRRFGVWWQKQYGITPTAKPV